MIAAGGRGFRLRSGNNKTGYTGDMEAAIGAMFGSGVHAVAANGVIGDPARASVGHGARYWEKVTEVTLTAVGQR
jgi:creatinine amidohydrolase/Fe(II)-dependent formamide hydrolase-like protein